MIVLFSFINSEEVVNSVVVLSSGLFLLETDDTELVATIVSLRMLLVLNNSLCFSEKFSTAAVVVFTTAIELTVSLQKTYFFVEHTSVSI